MAPNAEIKPTAEKRIHLVASNIEDDVKHVELVRDAAAQGQAETGYENLTIWQTVKTFKTATALCTLAAFSAAADGYQVGINASIIANKGFVRQFATKYKPDGSPYLASPILSGWGSIMSVGQIIGMVTVPFISNQFGRKVAMYWLWIILTASVIAESLARNWQVWLVAKLLAGIGIGCVQSTIPPYIAELAPIRIRGGLIMAYSLWWTTGSFFAQIALQNLNAKHPYQYLTAIYTQWAQIGLIYLIIFFLPESPIWLTTCGQEEKAKKALAKINRNVPGYDVDYQYKLMGMLIDHERTVAAEQRQEKWYSIFKGTDGRRTLIALVPGVSQHFIGMKLFGTFGTYFFQQAGVKQPFTVKCITSSIQIATTIVNILIADRFGRRTMACTAVTVSWLCCIVVGILGVTPITNARTYVFVVFACFWNMGMVTIGSASASSTSEISTQRLRPYTAGAATAFTAVVGVIMDVLVPYMVNANEWNWHFKTGWFYAGLGGIAVVAIWALFPETSGRSPAEIDELFERKIPSRKFAETQTATQRLVTNESTIRV